MKKLKVGLERKNGKEWRVPLYCTEIIWFDVVNLKSV